MCYTICQYMSQTFWSIFGMTTYSPFDYHICNFANWPNLEFQKLWETSHACLTSGLKTVSHLVIFFQKCTANVPIGKKGCSLSVFFVTSSHAQFQSSVSFPMLMNICILLDAVLSYLLLLCLWRGIMCPGSSVGRFGKKEEIMCATLWIGCGIFSGWAEALQTVVAECKPGVKVVDLCDKGDALIRE